MKPEDPSLNVEENFVNLATRGFVFWLKYGSLFQFHVVFSTELPPANGLRAAEEAISYTTPQLGL